MDANTSDREDRRWRHLTHISGQLFWSILPNGVAQDSSSWRAYTGQAYDEIQGWGWLQSIHPDDRDHARLVWEAAIPTKAAFQNEFRLRRADGIYRDFVMTGIPILNDAEEIEEWVGTGTDITERKRLEATLSAQAQELEIIFEAITDGVAIYDRDGTIIRFNQANYHLLGITDRATYLTLTSEMRGRQIDARDPLGTPIPAGQAPHERVLRGEILAGSTALDYRIRTPDGRELRLNITGAPLFDADGQIRGAVTISRDVTSRRQLEDEARQRTTELEAIIEAMTDSVIVYDRESRIQRMNTAARRLIAAPESMTLAHLTDDRESQYQLQDLGGRPLSSEEWPISRLLRGETLSDSSAMDIQMKAWNEVALILNVTGSPLRDASEAIVGAVAVSHDVTQQRQLQRQLVSTITVLLQVAQLVANLPLASESEDLLISIAKTLSDLVSVDFVHAMLIDEDGHLTPLALYGISAEEEVLWKEGVSAFDPGTVPNFAALRARLHQDEPLLQYFEHEKPLISSLFVESHHIRSAITAPILVEGRLIGLLTIARARAKEHWNADHFAEWDIELLKGVGRLAGEALTRVRLSRRLTIADAARLAAEETARKQDEFLSIAGHELRTPLTSTSISVQLAERHVNRMLMASTEQAGLLTSLQKLQSILGRTGYLIQRQARLVDDLLDVSRIQMGKLELRRERCDIVALTRAIVEEQRLLHPESSLSLDIPSRLAQHPAMVLADPHRIEQVLINFLSNAFKYAPVRSPITVQIRQKAHELCVSVKDVGPGLSSEDQERVWERFHRVPSMQVQNGSEIGLGLGLYICKTIIEQHHGRAGIESQVGVGSSFWFTLPLSSPRDEKDR